MLQRVITRTGARRPAVIGAIGMLLITPAAAASANIVVMVGFLLALGVAQGLLFGPMNALVVDDMQRCLALISQRGRQHLQVPGTAQTFCGQNVTGKELAFRNARPLAQTAPEAVVPRRDLFAEWESGKVCRHCLMNALTAHWQWSTQALAYQGDGAA